MTQVGYGDLVPHTDLEVVAIIFTMMVGASVFSFIVGNAAQFIHDIEGRSGQVRKVLDELSDFMRDAKLTRKVRSKVLQYFENHWLRPHAMLPAVSAGLPKVLAGEVKQRVCDGALFVSSARSGPNEDGKVKGETQLTPLLLELAGQTLARVIEMLQTREFIPGEDVMRAGDEAYGVMFLLSGKLEVVDRDGFTLATLFRGSYVGENSLLQGERNVCTIKARTWVEVLFLPYKDLRGLLMECEEEAHWMVTVAAGEGCV